MLTGFLILIVGIALLPTASDAQQPPNGAARTTVCDLLREPDRFNRKPVEIDAQISWSEEGSVIFDQKCSGSIPFGVSPQMDARTQKQYLRLMRLLKKTNVAARVSGVFEHSEERVWGHQSMFDSRLLTTEISRVREIGRGH